MESIGERIRRMRMARGLSQQALAGADLSRSFICRIERGKVAPSRRTLELIAARLGRPVEYFTGETAPAERLSGEVRQLRTLAEQALAAGQAEAALAPARQALAAALTLDQRDAEWEARLLLVKVHERLSQYRAALEAAEPLLSPGRGTASPRLLGEAFLHLGDCHTQLEEFLAARGHFQRALVVTAGRRRLASLHIKAHLRLACCSARLGELDAAARSYTAALELGAPADRGLARLGLGAVRFEQGDVAAGLAHTRAARAILQSLGHPGAVWAAHNEAVMEARSGHWERSIDLLTDLLHLYAEQGERQLQASALEEIAECFLTHGFVHEALEVCGQALDLLAGNGDSRLRGRLYGLTARAHAAAGETQRAHDLGLVSLELLRRAGARGDLEAAMAFLAPP